METLGPHTLGPYIPDPPSEVSGAGNAAADHGSGLTERFPLSFPKARWATFDGEEQVQFHQAQLLLDVLSSGGAATIGALAEDTQLDHEELGRGLGLLEELGLVDLDEGDSDGELLITLLATPEEHMQVRFPDGEFRWIFISRPVREPELDPSELN